MQVVQLNCHSVFICGFLQSRKMNAAILQRMWTHTLHFIIHNNSPVRGKENFQTCMLLFAAFDSFFVSVYVGLCDCWTHRRLRVGVQFRAWTFFLNVLFYYSGRLNYGVVTNPLDPADFLAQGLRVFNTRRDHDSIYWDLTMTNDRIGPSGVCNERYCSWQLGLQRQIDVSTWFIYNTSVTNRS